MRAYTSYDLQMRFEVCKFDTAFCKAKFTSIGFIGTLVVVTWSPRYAHAVDKREHGVVILLFIHVENSRIRDVESVESNAARRAKTTACEQNILGG